MTQGKGYRLAVEGEESVFTHYARSWPHLAGDQAGAPSLTILQLWKLPKGREIKSDLGKEAVQEGGPPAYRTPRPMTKPGNPAIEDR
jgi:hypothetical protein